MKKYCIAALLLLCAAAAFADDDTEHLLLPETPPTIERQKKPPLDQPRVRKQDFVADADISLPPVLMGLNFTAFDERTYPVSAGFYRGSFSSLGGHFAYASPRGYELGGSSEYTDGETPRLALAHSLFRYRGEKDFAPGLTGRGAAVLEERDVWNERKDFYRFDTGLDWFLSPEANIKTGLAYARGEVRGAEADETLRGDISGTWIPFEGHSLLLTLSPRRDTAFPRYGIFTDASMKYTVLLRDTLSLAGGYAYEGEKLYPRAESAWSALPGMRLSVAYRPGVEDLSWKDLYINDLYLVTARDLLFPEDTFRLEETAAWYWGERSRAELSFRQANVKDYLYWDTLPGTDFILPKNGGEAYDAAASLSVVDQGRALTERFSATQRTNAALPLVPAFSLNASLEYLLGSWTFIAGYEYAGDRFAARNTADKLSAYGNLSLGARKSFAGALEFNVAVDNLAGAAIELQPGFVRKSPAVKAGVDLKFN